MCVSRHPCSSNTGTSSLSLTPEKCRSGRDPGRKVLPCSVAPGCTQQAEHKLKTATSDSRPPRWAAVSGRCGSAGRFPALRSPGSLRLQPLGVLELQCDLKRLGDVRSLGGQRGLASVLSESRAQGDHSRRQGKACTVEAEIEISQNPTQHSR